MWGRDRGATIPARLTVVSGDNPDLRARRADPVFCYLIQVVAQCQHLVQMVVKLAPQNAKIGGGVEIVVSLGTKDHHCVMGFCQFGAEIRLLIHQRLPVLAVGFVVVVPAPDQRVARCRISRDPCQSRKSASVRPDVPTSSTAKSRTPSPFTSARTKVEFWVVTIQTELAAGPELLKDND